MVAKDINLMWINVYFGGEKNIRRGLIIVLAFSNFSEREREREREREGGREGGREGAQNKFAGSSYNPEVV